jgi:hypothetical protein
MFQVKNFLIVPASLALLGMVAKRDWGEPESARDIFILKISAMFPLSFVFKHGASALASKEARGDTHKCSCLNQMQHLDLREVCIFPLMVHPS